MSDRPAIQEIIGGFAVSPFIFRIAPVGFFVGLWPVGFFLSSYYDRRPPMVIFRISETEFTFLGRIGIPEAMVM